MRLSDEEIIAAHTADPAGKAQERLRESRAQSAETRQRSAEWGAVVRAMAAASATISERRDQTLEKIMSRVNMESELPVTAPRIPVVVPYRAEKALVLCGVLTVLAVSILILRQDSRQILDDQTTPSVDSYTVYVVLSDFESIEKLPALTYSNLHEAIASVPNGGEIQFLGGSTSETPRFEESVTLKTAGQPVRIGSHGAFLHGASKEDI